MESRKCIARLKVPATNSSIVRLPLSRFDGTNCKCRIPPFWWGCGSNWGSRQIGNKTKGSRGYTWHASRNATFGQVIRERRRQLDLTQEEVARRIKTSTPYVGHLESGKRHPSDKILTRLAEVLGLDRRELFFLANPRAQALLTPRGRDLPPNRRGKISSSNEQLRRVHNVTGGEMEMLSRVALLGDVRSTRDFIYILNTVRHAVGR